ncbi:uncharacterized protein LOC125587045 [Brassica napus]|uniref:uncharacterized protein LOC125587045 n=1 Tax=Brassica napus TaxID=3708 RepID=UPI00207AB78B|nr:uncharacterized protein LOC125587045 [Brassica napus]
MQDFQAHFGYDNLVTVDPIGRSGGLALYYNNEFEVTISYTSNRMIDVEAAALGRRVYITFVYGDPVQELREHVWERLTQFGLARSEPWFVIGDLNEITGNHEKDGGAMRNPDSFVPFNTMIRNSGLLEFPARGNKLSWQGRRGKGVGAVMVRCRLDRALANEEWHTLFPCSYTEYLRMVASDHRPVVAYLEDKVVRRKGQFKFDKRWIGQDGLLEAITSGWKEQNSSQPEPFVTKISNCRHEIAQWRKDNPPFGKDKINELQKALEEVQMDNNRSQEDILEVSRKLQEAYRDEEDYWFQKSRNMWYSSGDRNTKFYHALTRQRRVRNRIVGLHDADGNWITDDEGVEKVAVNYFDELFTTTSPTAFDNFLSEIQPSISTQTNGWLLKPATEEEIRQALFMMHPGKAPCPDGMTALFFQHSWHIIKTNLVELVLCQRLKICLPSLISETQSAFVAGRLISDNILIAQEMFHGLRANKACQGKFMAIKTDMSKAYDRLEWDFIQAILLKMGFDTHWVKLMMACISSVQYRILLNGQPRGLIIPQRGLRQGDTLSPYLFILCTETLIANIKKAEREKQLTGMKVARACPSISHLLFADDSLFFCKAQEAECQTILRILQDYAAVSGQLINFQKSSIQFGHKIEDSKRQMMRDILGIQNVGGMGTYLGLPENMGGSKIQIFGFVQDRVSSRVNGWAFRYFTKGGKEVVIKSVVTAMPNHVMSCYRLPKANTKKITSVVARFWWSPGGSTRGMHWKSWDKVCAPKEQGGLGFKDITDFNTTMLGKQLWRLIEKPNTLFARVFKGRYYRNASPLDPIRSYSPSYGWRSIISARSLVIRWSGYTQINNLRQKPTDPRQEGCKEISVALDVVLQRNL